MFYSINYSRLIKHRLFARRVMAIWLYRPSRVRGNRSCIHSEQLAKRHAYTSSIMTTINSVWSPTVYWPISHTISFPYFPLAVYQRTTRLQTWHYVLARCWRQNIRIWSGTVFWPLAFRRYSTAQKNNFGINIGHLTYTPLSYYFTNYWTYLLFCNRLTITVVL